MKQAFLIIAHSDFKHLQRLISAIDNECADIYIHIERKVRYVPAFESKKSKIHIISDRIHVIWGDITQIKVQYILLKSAMAGGDYTRFNIISGTHYPLLRIEEIVSKLNSYGSAAALQPIAVSKDEMKMKLGHYHYFLTHLSSKIYWLNRLYHYLWRAFMYPQRRFFRCRDFSYAGEKMSQWCSLSKEAVIRILSVEKYILHKFRHTFCSDEFFICSALKGSPIEVRKCDSLLFTDFKSCSPVILTESDFGRLKESGCMFARKFNDKSDGIIKLINDDIRISN